MYSKVTAKYKVLVLVVSFAMLYNFSVSAISAYSSARSVFSEVTILSPRLSEGTDTVSPKYIVNPYQIYTYEQMLIDLAKLEDMHPSLFRSYSIGKSVEGREITAFEFGKGERRVILTGTIHAREYITTIFLMYMVDHYAYGYTQNEVWEGHSVRKALDSVTFVVVPMINPDGVNLVQNGADTAQNPDFIHEVLSRSDGLSEKNWKANINGVDLNRNFPSRWEKSTIAAPTTSEFGGYAPLSEPETIALNRLYSTTPFYMNVAFHSQGETIFWLDSHNKHLKPKFEPIVSRIAKGIGFTVAPLSKNQAYGYLGDYINDTYGKLNMTVELCPLIGNSPYPVEDFDTVARRAKLVGLLIADETMKIEEMPYSVYRSEEHVQIFDSKQQASSFAALYPDGWVVSN